MIRHSYVVAAALLALAPAALHAQKEESQAQLMKEAKVSLATAMATAKHEVPNAKITEHGLEREKGKLIWSFDMKIAGKSGIEEVNVDAMTGAMIEHVHESPADEKKEAAADAKAAKVVRKP